MILNESHVEEAALGLLAELGYAIGHGPRMAPGEPAEERRSFADVVLPGRLREAIWQLNPSIPMDAREEALRKILRFDTTSLVGNNRAFHRLLRDGVPVEYRRPDGSIAGDRVQLLNFADPAANDWLAVNQFTVIEGQHNRRDAGGSRFTREPPRALLPTRCQKRGTTRHRSPLKPPQFARIQPDGGSGAV